MRCPRCQATNPVGARFCEECGARLARICPHCRAEVSSGKRFCWSCGVPLADPDTDRVPPPVAYTPEHLAERILTSKVALEGERKKITVLFADTKASMELLADRDPEDARKLLDPVLEQMMESRPSTLGCAPPDARGYRQRGTELGLCQGRRVARRTTNKSASR